MRPMIRLSFASAIALALTAGCAKKDAATTDTQTSAGAVATTPAPAPTALQVADIGLGKKLEAGNHVTNEATAYGTRDTIYAAVHTTGTGQNASLTARWTFQDGQVVNERTETISPTGDAYTEFHISAPKGWPVGKYTLHVLLNGTEVQTKEFDVKK